MFAERVAQLTNLLLTHALTGARPALASDGVDLASWRSGPYGPIAAQIYLDGTLAASIAQPAGAGSGVELWGFKLGAWWRMAILNGGAPIVIVSDSLGATERVDDLGGFDRLFVAGAPSAGAVIAQFVPYEVVR